MNPSKLVALMFAALGAVLLCVGLILGFSGVSKGGIDCGSAFKPDSHDAMVSEYTDALGGYGNPTASEDCEDATSGRKTVAWALTIPGGLLLGGGLFGFALVKSNEAAKRLPRENE